MIDPNNVPAVADTELLARFILHSNEIRNDGTVKPKLFLPYSLVELSVNSSTTCRLRPASTLPSVDSAL